LLHERGPALAMGWVWTCGALPAPHIVTVMRGKDRPHEFPWLTSPSSCRRRRRASVYAGTRKRKGDGPVFPAIGGGNPPRSDFPARRPPPLLPRCGPGMATIFRRSFGG